MKQQVFHIVGPQGAGKSRLAHQLARSFDNGTTTIDRFSEGTPNPTAWESSAAEIVIVEHGNLVSKITPRTGEQIITLILPNEPPTPNLLDHTPLLTHQGLDVMSSDFCTQMVAASRALIRDFEAITTPDNVKNSFFAESVQQTFGANVAALRCAVHAMQALSATAKRECLL